MSHALRAQGNSFPCILHPNFFFYQLGHKNVFRGRYEHSIDEKGRLAVPSKFRADLTGSDDTEGTVVITNFDKCLLAYPLKEWEVLETKVASLPQFDAKVIAFQRYFISGAVECPIDKAGRVLIPQNLRQHAKLERECVIAGQVRKFEIWSQDLWNQEFTCIADQFANISQAMSQLGIQL